jgi:hypothetical protein
MGRAKDPTAYRLMRKIDTEGRLSSKQRMIAERFGGLDEGLVNRCRRTIREKSRLNRDPKVV